MICCNLQDIYLIPFNEIKGKKDFIIRESLPKNGQIKGINFAKDFIISKDRIDQVFK